MLQTTTLFDLITGFESVFTTPSFAGQHWPQFEHRALHDLPSSHFLDRGYEVVRGEIGKLPLFLQGGINGNDRVELIDPTVPPHMAYATRLEGSLQQLLGRFTSPVGHFELIEGGRFDVERDDLRAVLLRHTTSRDVIQLIWRRVQIFKGVFPSE